MEDETINEAVAPLAISLSETWVMRHFGRRFGDIDVQVKSHVYLNVHIVYKI